MGAMPKIMESMNKMKEMQAKLKETPVTGSALDGRVQVTLTAALVPVDVAIDESVMSEVSAKELSAGVLAAMKDAHNASWKVTSGQLSEVYGSMGLPGNPADLAGLGGAGAPAQAPAPAPKPDLPFDPIGLRSVD